MNIYSKVNSGNSTWNKYGHGGAGGGHSDGPHYIIPYQNVRAWCFAQLAKVI